MLTTVKTEKLVMDFNLYPRTKVESVNVSMLGDAFDAGVEIPPILVDKKSLRVVDGFHRLTLYKKRKLEEIKVDLKSYKSDQEIFLDAMSLNAHHGRSLSLFDKARCIQHAKELGIDNEHLSVVLCLTKDRITELETDRFASVKVAGKSGGQPIAIKRTIMHMQGERLTEAQANIIPKLGGMQPAFYANQLIMLIENDLLDRSNEHLMEVLKHLHDLLTEFTS